MSRFDMVLDECARCGAIDGETAGRIREALRRDVMRHEALVRAARAVVDAVRDDMGDDAHRSCDGRCSAVVEWRCCPARDCFTAGFNALVDDLQDCMDREAGED